VNPKPYIDPTHTQVLYPTPLRTQARHAATLLRELEEQLDTQEEAVPLEKNPWHPKP
jgi:hypothetical protein